MSEAIGRRNSGRARNQAAAVKTMEAAKMPKPHQLLLSSFDAYMWLRFLRAPVASTRVTWTITKATK
ncbi:hypothetical protein D3C73_1640120 [compost metagenome]